MVEYASFLYDWRIGENLMGHVTHQNLSEHVGYMGWSAWAAGMEQCLTQPIQNALH